MADQPPSHMPHYDYRDDEISLYELWNTLVKRRVLIGVVLALSVAGASVYALTRTPVYTMDAVLEVGVMPSVGEDGMAVQSIEAPSGLVTRLNEVVIPQVVDEQDATSAVTAELLSKESRLVRLHAQVTQADAAAASDSINAITDNLIETHDSQIAQSAAYYEQRLQETQAELARVLQSNQALTGAMQAAERANSAQESQVESLNRQLAATLSSIVGAIISRDATSEISGIRNTIAQLEVAEDTMRPTQVVRAPALADEPEGQPAATIIALGAVLGLMLGVFAAFGREFLANAAEQA